MKQRKIQNRLTRPFAAMLIALVAVAVLTSSAPMVRAAAPVNAISYQGRLLDSFGNPVSDASAEFVFRLFGSAAGIDCLWQSDDGAACAGVATQTVALTDGLFSENIGSSVDPVGLSEAYPVDLAGIFEANANVYLEVVINGETLTPRKQIVAAPYALNSQSLDGLDSTAFLSATGDTATGAFDLTGATIAGASALSFEGGTINGFQTTFSITDPTADNIITFQNASGTVALTSDIPAGSSLWETSAFGTYEDDANVIVGTLGDETILNAAFTLSGNDLFVADMLGVEGSVYSDGSFVAGTTSFGNGAVTTGAAQDLSLAIAGGDLTFAQDTVIGDGADQLSINSFDWDISVTGDLTNIGSISADGTVTATGDVTMNDVGADTIAIGAAADTVTIASNALSLADDNWNVTAAGAANFASIGVATPGSGAFTSLSANGIVSLGDGGDTAAVSSSGWSVSTAGTLTGIAAIASDDNQGTLLTNVNVTGVDAGLHSVGLQIDGNSGLLVSATGDGAGGVGARTVDIGVSGATDVVNVGDATSSISIGGATADVQITDTQWSVTTAGLITTAGDVAVNGGDVTSTGSLTLDSSGTVQLGANDNLITTGSITGTMTGTETIGVSSTPVADTAGDAMTISFAPADNFGLDEANYALHVIQTDSGTNPDEGADALIFLENTSNDASTGLLLGPGLDTGVDFNLMSGTTDIRLQNAETITNNVDDFVSLTGTLGADDTDIQFDLDGTMPVISSSTDASVSVAENLLVGATAVAGVKAAFVLSGDDLYAAGDIAAQFNMYADTFVAGDASTTFADGSITTTGATDLSLAIAGGDLTFAQDTVIGDGGDALSISSTTWSVSTAGLITTASDVTINGGDLIAAAGASFNVANAATTLNIGSTDLVRAVNVGTGAFADTINIGTGAGADAINIGMAGGAGTLTLIGGSTSSVTLGGTVFDRDSLDFAVGGTVSSPAGSKLILDSDITAADVIQAGDGDGLLLPAANATNGLFVDSPFLNLRGSFDFDAGAGTTAVQFNSKITTNMLSAGPTRTANLEFNLGVDGDVTPEMYLSQSGDFTAIGGTTFGDSTNTDLFSFTSAASVVDAMTLTANSETTANAMKINVNALTSGSGLFVSRADDAGAGAFTSTAGLLNVSQLDSSATSNGYVAKFLNSGTGPSVFVDANGNTGSTVGDAAGGAVHISNTGNADYGLTVYSNQAASTSPLAYLFSENIAFDSDTLQVRSNATAAGDNATQDLAALRVFMKDVGNPTDNAVNNGGIVIDTDDTDAANGDTLQQEIFQIRRSSGANTVFAVDVDGDFGYDGTAYTTAADVAESYQSVDALEPGELVVAGDATDSVVRTSVSYQSQILGAISTRPGILLGSSGADGATDTGYKLALAGRVPVKVTDENGPIAIGDPISSSSTAGFGMRSTEAGMIVGFALEAFSGHGTGTISTFINPQFYVGSVLATDGSGTVMIGDLAMGATGTATAATTGFDSSAFALRGSGWDGVAAQNVQMSVSADVTNASDYRLSIKNTAGSEVAYVSQAGDVAMAGRLYPSDRGTLQTSKYIYYDGSSGMGGDFMRTNASGWATGSYDFAEMFPSTDTLEPGDVVKFGTSNESVLKSTGSSAALAGIVSTRPGFLAGENLAGNYPIALAGRVPTKVSLENGSIAIGDPLTASATAGYAMKAVASGPIVGYALEAYAGTAGVDDKIVAFVNAGYWNGGATSPTPGTSNTASTIVVSQNATNLSVLNMTGNVYLAGNDILGVRRIAGLSDVWSLEADGTVKTEATLKSVITSYQGDKVETTAVTSPDVQITLVGTATLVNGEATIRFEDASPTFNDVTSTTAPIRVIVTPNGPVSLYVTEKNHDGFGVRQVGGSDSDVTFDWMVSAFRKDYEPVLSSEASAQEAEAVPVIDSSVDPVVTDPGIVTDVPVDGNVVSEETVPNANPVPEIAVPVSPDVVAPQDEASAPIADSTESNSGNIAP